MDSSPVAAPNTAAQDQNNSKSNPGSKSSEKDTEGGNVVRDSGSIMDSENSGSTTSAEPVVSEPNTYEGKMQASTEQSKSNSGESSQGNITTNLYPVLPSDSSASNQYTQAEQVANLSVSGGTGGNCSVSNVHINKSQTCDGKNNAESSVNVEPDKDNVILPSSPGFQDLKGDSKEDKDKNETSQTSASPSSSAISAAGLAAAPNISGLAIGGAEAFPSCSAVENGTETSSGAGKAKSSDSPGNGESVYYVKWIMFDNSKVPIITQNENGPCPLLAVMNVLLLKGKVRLAPIVEMITSEQLMAHLGDCVVESMPKNLDETSRANYEQNMQDAMDLMHKLQTGLDVNVKFTGVSDFEYTSECIIFDLLEIALYHGWLVDPQDEQSVHAVGKCSYNQLVEKVIQNKHSDSDVNIREALIAEQFLDRTAAQLTYHGLCELSSTVKEQELCVFFRNNHFNTLYRHNSELFLLVTDQGFLTESGVVWETLSNVDGDCHFVDANFCTYAKPPPSTDPIPSSPYSSGDEQINSDYQVALSLQHHDQQMMAEQEAAWGQFHNEFGAAQNADHELALRLQEEEDRRAAAALHDQRNQQGQGQAPSQGQGQGQVAGGASGERRPREREERREKKEGKDCCIL